VTLLVNNSVGQGLAFLTSVAIGRVLGAAAFGSYAAVMAMVFVLGMVAEAGLEASMTREVARRPERSRALLAASLRAKGARGGVLALLLAVPPLAETLAPDPTAVGAIRLSGVLLGLNAANSSFSAVFRAWGKMRYVLLVNLTGLAVQLVGVLVVVHVAPSVTSLIAWLALVQVGELLGGLALFRRGEAQIVREGADAAPGGSAGTSPTEGTGPLLRRSLPFALAGVLGALQLRVDLFLVEALRGPAGVAMFSVASRLQGLLTLAPASFFAVLFPALAAAHGENGSVAGERLYRRALMRMALVGSAAVAVGLALADVLVVVAFGRAYAAARHPADPRRAGIPVCSTPPRPCTSTPPVARDCQLDAALNVALRVVVGWPLVRLRGPGSRAGGPGG
jgi:O-antigen/teichoic acid export membrane protein